MTEEKKRFIEARLESISQELMSYACELGYGLDIYASAECSRMLSLYIYDGCVIYRDETWKGALDSTFDRAWEYLDEDKKQAAWDKYFGGKE